LSSHFLSKNIIIPVSFWVWNLVPHLRGRRRVEAVSKPTREKNVRPTKEKITGNEKI
jgi:hypothetical protein